jgi:hypothetical protein
VKRILNVIKMHGTTIKKTSQIFNGKMQSKAIKDLISSLSSNNLNFELNRSFVNRIQLPRYVTKALSAVLAMHKSSLHLPIEDRHVQCFSHDYNRKHFSVLFSRF